MRMKCRFWAFSLLMMMLSFQAFAVGWHRQTTDWRNHPRLTIGDWGVNRPGFPEGLYIEGITVRAGQAVRNPVIYDNDVYDDVFDDEWMFAMASLGRMNLVGQIITPVQSEKWYFYHKEWPQTGYEAYQRAVKSGMNMKRIPMITLGTVAESEREGEGKESAGARLYVKLINYYYRKNPRLPLLINIGGQAATLASAWCMDSTIANKCMVYYTDMKDYNGQYSWASELVAQHFRVINWGNDEHWWHSKICQNQWNVLPRPRNCEARDNGPESGEWKLLTDMHVPILDYIVYQFTHRKEICCEGYKADGYCDGTFMHAWLPGIFSSVAIQRVRKGLVLQVTGFTEKNEALVKQFTMETLLNRKAYFVH